MTRAPHGLIVTVFATLVLSGSAGAQLDQITPLRASPPPTAPSTAPAPKAVQQDDVLPTLDDLSATRERPLFSSTRRPPEVEEPKEAAAPITEGASMPFELVGIVLGGDVSAAIFRNTESKEETRVTRGEKIGNWSVEDVTERAVVLRGGEKRVRMRLFNEANTPGIKVGRVGGNGEAAEPEASADDDDKFDEDIAPSSSPQVRPATAQPKPPPSLQNNQRRRATRPGRGNQRPRQQP